MAKYFDVNAKGHSIKCRLYCNNPRAIGTLVLFGHGFGGHKDNRAAERFAQSLLSAHKNAAVLTFNWPCHGDDVKKVLRLSDCDTYLTLIIDYVREHFSPERICGHATSFGAYLFLKYIAEHGSPFDRMVLRSPAIPMYESLTQNIITPQDRAILQKGKTAAVGFDRKINIDPLFLEELKAADITAFDYLDYAEDILILHGDKDEIIPIDTVRAFADNNLIEFETLKNGDHRLCDPAIMGTAINKTIRFLFPKA